MKELNVVLILFICFVVASVFDAHAFEVWSGEFEAETKDGATVGFVATFPMEQADCIKNEIRSTIGKFTKEQFDVKKETILLAADMYAKGSCGS